MNFKTVFRVAGFTLLVEAAAGVEEGDLLGALPVARLALGGVQGWWVLELKLGASIYRQIDGVAVNGESPASDYGGAVDWKVV